MPTILSVLVDKRKEVCGTDKNRENQRRKNFPRSALVGQYPRRTPRNTMEFCSQNVGPRFPQQNASPALAATYDRSCAQAQNKIQKSPSAREFCLSARVGAALDKSIVGSPSIDRPRSMLRPIFSTRLPLATTAPSPPFGSEIHGWRATSPTEVSAGAGPGPWRDTSRTPGGRDAIRP